MKRSYQPAKVVGLSAAARLAICILALAAITIAPRSYAAGAPTLQLRAPSQVAAGEAIPVTLVVSAAADLAGYETAVRFDPAAAEFAGLHQRDNDLRRMGRDIGSLAVAELASGAAIGLYSCPVASCAEYSGPRQARGASGDVTLATFDILPLQPGLLEIALDATKFVDADGNALAVAMPARTLSVQVGPAGGPRYAAPARPWALATAAPAVSAASVAASSLDLAADRQITHADVSEAEIDWTTSRERGQPCGALANPSRDVNRDGCIDVADLQLLAARAAPLQVAPTIAAALTLTVNSAGDGADANPGNGVCGTSGGSCTLRAAIEEANQQSGPNTIVFNIAGSGVQTIQLNSALPTLYDRSGGTAIDGYTQPGASPNTDPLISNAKIRIEIVGKGVRGFSAMLVTSPGNVVRGLSFYNLYRSIWLQGPAAHDNRVVGNFVGTNAAGTFVSTGTYTDASGVFLYQGAARNQIGGTAPADRNVISGNGRTGVAMWYEGTNQNVVVNNLIGFDPTGTRRVENKYHGIDMNSGSAYNIIGGTGPGERNVVCCSGRRGIEISHAGSTAYNRVIGNYVGTDVTGTRAPSWAYVASFGIQVKDRAANNVVSGNVVGNSRGAGIRVDEYYNPNTGVPTCCVGPNEFSYNRVGVGVDGSPIPNSVAGVYITAGNATIGPGNIIARNPIGIRIEGNASDRNRITQNAIYDNAGLGIDLEPIGQVNLNDRDDSDSGPNQQQNFPVLKSATPQQVTGTSCAGCAVEIFIASGGAGLYGEGRAFAGAATAGADGAFVAPLTGAAIGNYVTATATSPTGNTSEFASNLLVTAAPGTAPGLDKRLFLPVVQRR